MASRLNSDKVICRVLEDDFGLPQEEIANKRVAASLPLLGQTIGPKEVANLRQLHDQ